MSGADHIQARGRVTAIPGGGFYDVELDGPCGPLPHGRRARIALLPGALADRGGVNVETASRHDGLPNRTGNRTLPLPLPEQLTPAGGLLEWAGMQGRRAAPRLQRRPRSMAVALRGE
jgi:hypothetical protein